MLKIIAIVFLFSPAYCAKDFGNFNPADSFYVTVADSSNYRHGNTLDTYYKNGEYEFALNETTQMMCLNYFNGSVQWKDNYGFKTDPEKNLDLAYLRLKPDLDDIGLKLTCLIDGTYGNKEITITLTHNSKGSFEAGAREPHNVYLEKGESYVNNATCNGIAVSPIAGRVRSGPPNGTLIKNFSETDNGTVVHCIIYELFGYTYDRNKSTMTLYIKSETEREINNCTRKCKNSGICVDTNTCQCPANYHGKYCEFEKMPCLNYPPLPKNSMRKCSYGNLYATLCTITCMDGHKFINGSTVAYMSCLEGQWLPSRAEFATILDCQPQCDPPCLNGGVCLALNSCKCSTAFRGPQCQYSVSVCDVRKLAFNGGYKCFGDGEKFSCRLSCPAGSTNSSPPAPLYSCHYAHGVFQPQPIPHCVFKESKNITSYVVTYIVTSIVVVAAALILSGLIVRKFCLKKATLTANTTNEPVVLEDARNSILQHHYETVTEPTYDEPYAFPGPSPSGSHPTPSNIASRPRLPLPRDDLSDDIPYVHYDTPYEWRIFRLGVGRFTPRSRLRDNVHNLRRQ